MSDESATGEQLIGCAMALFALLITTPMFCAIMFALMCANQMPLWAWVCFWVYVPCQFLAIILASIARMLLKE